MLMTSAGLEMSSIPSSANVAPDAHKIALAMSVLHASDEQLDVLTGMISTLFAAPNMVIPSF